MHSFLDDATEAYTRRLQPDVDPLLEAMEEYAAEHDVPIAGRAVAAFQTMLVAATDADRVLEVGTAIGYTTIQLARAGAEVVTVERDADRAAVAREFVAEARVADAVELVEGDATERIRGLDGEFDLVFVDANKDEYGQYLDAALPLLRTNGLVVVDNLLWGGAVPAAAMDGEASDSRVAALLEFNEAFVTHPRLEAVVLPFADGTGVAVKTE